MGLYVKNTLCACRVFGYEWGGAYLPLKGGTGEYMELHGRMSLFGLIALRHEHFHIHIGIDKAIGKGSAFIQHTAPLDNKAVA